MKLMVYIIVVALMVVTLAGSTMSDTACGDPVRKTAFMESAFYTSGPVKVVREEDISQIHPELIPFSAGDGYCYWTAESGRVEMITLLDNANPSEVMNTEQICDKDDAVRVADELFDKAFQREEEQFGNRKSVRVSGGEMNDYLITVNLLWEGKETGNSASIVVSKAGQVLAAAFVYGELTADEPDRTAITSEDDAVRLAKDGLNAYIEGKSGIEASPGDKVDISGVEYRVFRNVRFYTVKGSVQFIRPQKWGTFDMPFEIRVNADTGECVEIATILE